MSRILIAVALVTTVAAFNAEAQSGLGSVKQTGAFRTQAYQQSGGLKIQPTGGQRHNNMINSGQYKPLSAKIRTYGTSNSGRIQSNSSGSWLHIYLNRAKRKTITR